MHNREGRVRSTVNDILDLAVQVRTGVRIVIVDDGSTDDTFECACELSRRFPQVIALRQSLRSGLSAVIDLVRNRLNAGIVILHDGVSPVNPESLRGFMLATKDDARERARAAHTLAEFDSCGSRRFGAVRSLHDHMERAHRNLVGFCWLKLEKPIVPRRRQVLEQDGELMEVRAKMPVTAVLPNLSQGVALTPMGKH